jgi:hypothetical protein
MTEQLISYHGLTADFAKMLAHVRISENMHAKVKSRRATLPRPLPASRRRQPVLEDISLRALSFRTMSFEAIAQCKAAA